MDQRIQSENQDRNYIESQLRESYGLVAYSHKTHEKMADICAQNLRRIKCAEIILSAITSTAILSVLVGDDQIIKIIAAITSTLLLGVTLYTKEFNLAQAVEKHTIAANELWFIRESFTSLLVDTKSGVDLDKIREKRDLLNEKLSKIYSGSPRTNSRAYKEAQEALKTCEEKTFSDEEIDALLPIGLRKNQKDK